MKILREQEGVSLYLTMMIMTAVFMVGLSIASFLLGEFRISRDIGTFVPTIYAADSGIERALYKIRRTGDFGPGTCIDSVSCIIDPPTTPFLNDANYSAFVLDPGFEWCVGPNKCIRGIGSIGDKNRAFEVSF